MAHPKWVLKHKAKGTEIRLINGNYYLYKISSKWDKRKKRAVKKTDAYLCRITEKDGLIPKGQRARKTKIETPARAREYGATHTLLTLGQDVVEALKNHFPNDWQTIYVLAMQKLLYQAPLKNMEFLFQESYLSETYTNLNLSKNSLTSFIRNLGLQDHALLMFKK